MRVLLLLSLIACTETPKGESPPAKPSGNADRGAEVYSSYCIACHQADGSGKPEGGKAIAGSFTGKDAVLKKPDEDLLRSIKAGKTGRIGSMPGWAGVLSKQQQLDVLAYLRKTFDGKP